MEDLLSMPAPTEKSKAAQEISFAPIGVDDDLSEDDDRVIFATKKDVKNVNRKLNILIQKIVPSQLTILLNSRSL